MVLHLCNAAWVKTPMKKKHVLTKERKVLKVEQSHHEHGGGNKGQRNCNLEKTVAGKTELSHEHI